MKNISLRTTVAQRRSPVEAEVVCHGGCVTSLADLLPALAQATPRQLDAVNRVLKGETYNIDAGGFIHAIEPLLTLRELAPRVGVSAPTLWRWKVPGHQLGGRPRYRLSEVLAYLDSEEFKRRAAALRAERKIAAKTPASKGRSTP